eukprot:1969633-Rhodomonas_salina.1
MRAICGNCSPYTWCMVSSVSFMSTMRCALATHEMLMQSSKAKQGHCAGMSIAPRGLQRW